MNHNNGTEADVITAVAVRPASSTVGMLISLNAGVGLVVGLLFGDMLLGMVYGAGSGILIGAIYGMWRQPVAETKGK